MRNIIAYMTIAVLSLAITTVNAQSYASLWKSEQAHEQAGKPQSAYAVTQQILRKAQKEGNRGQALSARMRAASLHQEWAPDSFYIDVQELEQLREQEQHPVARAVYASVLAQIYENNRDRSQASHLALSSSNMHEWTMEQFDSAARANWELSIEPMSELVSASSKEWLPFVKQDKHSAYFGHDMLHLLWQYYHSQMVNRWTDVGERIKNRGREIADQYRSRGNREATLLVELDICDEPASLLTSYSDLPLCTEVYIRMLQSNVPDSQKVAWAEEALRRYPRYERINDVRNTLNSLIMPVVEWQGNEICYPHKEYIWHLGAKNADAINIEVYRLPDSFKEEQLNNRKDPAAYLRQIGQRVETVTHHFKSNAAYKNTTDSIAWQAPGIGHYALLYTATTSEREATKKRETGHYNLLHVTSLQTLYQHHGDEIRAIVVDAESGQPVQRAIVSLLQEVDGEQRIIQSVRTNEEGRATLTCGKDNRTRTSLSVRTDNDTFLPEQYVWQSYRSTRNETERTVLHLYTDRAIYRPGQTVHVGGVVYSRMHWDASTIGDQEYELIFRDANWKEVTRETVHTDSMGVLAADFTIPVGRVPGTYRVQTNGGTITFRVEEYKRPTFEITLDEAPALQWPQDSIQLTGHAIGYNGVPVRDGRVTAFYQYVYPRYRWYRFNNSPRLPLDTVQTDEQGRFSIMVPLNNIPEEALLWGMTLSLDVDVLNSAGETRQGTSRIPLCTTPLRLTINMAEMQNRERLAAPTFTLLSSTDQPTAGTIRWSITPTNSVVGSFPADTPAASGTLTHPTSSLDTLLASLRSLPSGEYELQAFAEAGTDTASAHQRFVVFGMDDTTPATHQDLWLYCSNDTFSTAQSASLQIGSSYEDVALYWSLVANNEVVEQGVKHLDNELQQMEVPYRNSFGDGATVHFALVKGGKVYTKSQTLRLAMPDKELRWQWTSFRDRVHPGDTETWTLRITHPDGTPASANLMATVYDATLDALASHQWQMIVARAHNITAMPWRMQNYFTSTGMSSFYFPMRTYDVTELVFDCFNPEYYDGLPFMVRIFNHYDVRVRGTRPMMMASRAKNESAQADGAMVLAEVPVAAPMATQAIEGTEQELQGVIGGLDLDAEEAASEEDEMIGAASTAVRTNFNETAYFAPRLHTDANGSVSLHFTLPQSLTTWRMLGIAHTSDVQTAAIEAQTVAHKELMAHLYMPRFLRAGDEGTINATIQNLTKQPQSGKALLEIFDPETGKVLNKQRTDFTVSENNESVLTFTYTPSDQPTIIGVRLTAETTDFSDGEQYLLPILPNKTYITESVEIQADGMGVFTTDLTSLFNHNAASATNRVLTVEYTTHPIWTVVQSLPCLREPQHDDILSLTSTLYANALATHIAAETPRLREVITLWTEQYRQGGSALASPLEQDEELKQLVLDETPWLRDAMSDTERMEQLSSLFDENMLETTLNNTLQRLQERQQADGGFSWFPGMRSSELMTRLVATFLTQLRSLTNDFSTLPDDSKQGVNTLLSRAVGYLATENAKAVKDMKKAEAEGATIHTGNLMHLYYIYVSQRSGARLTSSQQADVRYLLDHLTGSVAGMNNQERAVAAIVLKGAGRNEWHTYYESMLEHLTVSSNHGSYFDYASGSFKPTSHKIVAHAAAMEAVRELDATNQALLSGLRRWLLQQKRTQMWESSMCTVNAIYALLHNNETQLSTTSHDELTLRYGKRNVKVESAANSPAALGYTKATYTDGRMPQSITVRRKSATEAWGAAYASYLTPYSDATAASTGLSVRRELSSANPKIGDQITIRYVITADRDYEYVCLRADRAACTEPAITRSGYHYQGGLGYYLAQHDAHTDYFFEHLPKGTYVLEERAFIDRDGKYTTGIAKIQCLYAPEFGGHTNSCDITTKQ
ncbi:MAG: hypothetical protein J5486_10310 [Bacteroidaceae bacterium]|nr:hypothetical protein [Bacteroidaceae bacterium]